MFIECGTHGVYFCDYKLRLLHLFVINIFNTDEDMQSQSYDFISLLSGLLECNVPIPVKLEQWLYKL